MPLAPAPTLRHNLDTGPPVGQRRRVALDVLPIINCADLARTQHWYERVLGGTERFRFPAQGDPEYVTLRIGAGEIGLGNGRAEALYGQVPLPATGHAVDICIYVPDLGQVTSAAGGDVVVPPADMPWGERVAYLADPEGTMLLVIQHADEDEASPSPP
jgi:catechol 2,3-dioxygenase-like lactoylglutathione lyase family enzyme